MFTIINNVNKMWSAIIFKRHSGAVTARSTKRLYLSPVLLNGGGGGGV